MELTYDVAVIGAGVVGAAIARELARHDLAAVLIEAGPDVGAGTSKANTAILHTGFDAPPGSLEAHLVRRGYQLLKAYAEEADIAVEPTGAILVAWSDEQLAQFPSLRDKAAQNGVTDLRPLDAAELYRLEPALGPGALGGLLIPGEGIICPYSPPLAYAYEAVQNGIALLLDAPVSSLERGADAHVLTAGVHAVRARYVVNAAGLGADVIDRLFGHQRFRLTPRRGELIVFDKLARSLVSHVLLPVPTKTTKGVLVSPTVFGNVLLGPTAEDLTDRADTRTSEAGLRALWEKGGAIMPALMKEEVTATYAGLRAAAQPTDYQIYVDREQRYVCAGGIRSTGLSASLGIAEHVVALLGEAGLALRPKAAWRPVRMPYLGQMRARLSESAARVAENGDYGRIVCHCERVSRGELDDATRAPIAARTLDGLRRRTRCLQGRCQGFYCLAQVTAILSQAANRPIASLLGLDE